MLSQLHTPDLYRDFSEYIARFMDIGPELENRIFSVAQPHVAKKGDHLLRTGETNEYYYFLQKGALHVYYNRGRKRVTSWISMDQELLTTVDTLTKPRPARENIEVLEDSVLLRISRKNMEQLYAESKQFERLMRLAVSHYFGVMNRKLHASYFMSAKERYDSLLERHPEVTFRIPLGVIASYLGISQETLSRIRNPKYGRTKK